VQEDFRIHNTRIGAKKTLSRKNAKERESQARGVLARLQRPPGPESQAGCSSGGTRATSKWSIPTGGKERKGRPPRPAEGQWPPRQAGRGAAKRRGRRRQRPGRTGAVPASTTADAPAGAGAAAPPPPPGRGPRAGRVVIDSQGVASPARPAAPAAGSTAPAVARRRLHNAPWSARSHTPQAERPSGEIGRHGHQVGAPRSKGGRGGSRSRSACPRPTAIKRRMMELGEMGQPSRRPSTDDANRGSAGRGCSNKKVTFHHAAERGVAGPSRSTRTPRTSWVDSLERPPWVDILGHRDHGQQQTSLLDAISGQTEVARPGEGPGGIHAAHRRILPVHHGDQHRHLSSNTPGATRRSPPFARAPRAGAGGRHRGGGWWPPTTGCDLPQGRWRGGDHPRRGGDVPIHGGESTRIGQGGRRIPNRRAQASSPRQDLTRTGLGVWGPEFLRTSRRRRRKNLDGAARDGFITLGADIQGS